MKKVPLSYYVNLFITEKCIELYDIDEMIGYKRILSEYYSHLSYLRTYFISETTSRPDVVNKTFWRLLKAMGDMYGFGPELATDFISKYFRDERYKKYLDYVITYNQYLEYKN